MNFTVDSSDAEGGTVVILGDPKKTEWMIACEVRLGSPYRVQVECIKYVSIGDGI